MGWRGGLVGGESGGLVISSLYVAALMCLYSTSASQRDYQVSKFEQQ